jgi:hypothetical protein
MLLTLRGALIELAQIMPNGDETMIQDNANYPITIWAEYDSIDSFDDRIEDYAFNADGIFKINDYGMIETIPVYRVI